MTIPFAIDPLYAVSGLFVGLLVGQTGVGGGSLMTPILMLFFGINPATAVGTDLLYASITKGVGTCVHGLSHTVDWRIVGRLAAGSMPGAAFSLLLMSNLDLSAAGPAHVLSLILGFMLIVTAAALLARARILRRAAPLIDRMTPRRAARLTVVIGLALGVLVTLTSIGAGALGVTALLILYPRERMARIVGTDIAHAVPLTLLAGIGHLYLGSVNVHVLISLLTGSIPGIVIGSWLASRVPEFVLRPILAATLAVVGLRIVL